MKKRFAIAMCVLLAAATMQAQDKILDKYSKMGDVSTTTVSRRMLDSLSDEQRELLTSGAMQGIADKVDNIKILSSSNAKASKQLKMKLPKQLMSSGYRRLATTQQGKATVMVLQSKEDPNSMVFVIVEGPKTTVASVKGSFTD